MDLSLEFTDADMLGIQYSHDDTLVVTTGIANHSVHRILVDSGSLVNILSQMTYDQMSLLADRLKLLPTPLYRFLGQCVTLKGSVELPLTVGASPK